MTAMPGTPDVLQRILEAKKREIAARESRVPLPEIRSRALDAAPPRGFYAAMVRAIGAGRAAVIAEIKKASPSRGVIRDDFDPAVLADGYARGGATCLSVLTDFEFFQGCDEYVRAAAAASGLPVLRKDFTLSPYQVFEARAIGADCVLLIVAALADGAMQELAGLAGELALDVLVEIHDREELERALMLRTPMIGINNRDLRTFETDLQTTLGLLADVFPDRLLITESGINTREDVAMMRRHGVNAFLVGEALMRAPDPGARLHELFSTE
jgi:indole-3-glycerol phosphate synthase